MEQISLNLYPDKKEHRSCKGCCHLEPVWRAAGPYSTREIVEYGCDLSNYGYRPKDGPRYARGCPDGLPEMWETFDELYERTDYLRLHPITGVPIRHIPSKPMPIEVVPDGKPS